MTALGAGIDANATRASRAGKEAGHHPARRGIR